MFFMTNHRINKYRGDKIILNLKKYILKIYIVILLKIHLMYFFRNQDLHCNIITF